MYRNITDVEHEMYDCTSNNWSLLNTNIGLKKNLDVITREHSKAIYIH